MPFKIIATKDLGTPGKLITLVNPESETFVALKGKPTGPSEYQYELSLGKSPNESTRKIFEKKLQEKGIDFIYWRALPDTTVGGIETSGNYVITMNTQNSDSVLNFLQQELDLAGIMLSDYSGTKIKEQVDEKKFQEPDHPFVLHEGPKNISSDTIKFKNVVNSLLENKEFKVTKNDLGSVFLSDSKDNSVNIWLLLNKASLEHLSFSSEEIKQYEEFLKSSEYLKRIPFFSKFSRFDGFDEAEIASLSEPLKSFPKGYLWALHYYTKPKFLNEYIRAKRIDTDDPDKIKFLILTIAMASSAINTLASHYSEKWSEILEKINRVAPDDQYEIFLNTQCDIKKINELIDQLNLKAVLTENDIQFLKEVYRPKKLKRLDKLDWFRYDKTLVTHSGLLSTSEESGDFFNVGLEYAHLKLEGHFPFLVNISSISETSTEQEVLFPSGSQYIIKLKEGDRKTSHHTLQFVSALTKSTISYDTGCALEFVYANYLSKPYSSGSSRENHGIAHTTRKVFYVDSVVNYLANHTADEPARKFYQQELSPEIIDYVKIASCFSVTGLDSEISFKDGSTLYLKYKAESAGHFDQYAKQIGMPDEWRTRLTELVRELGNPNYYNTQTKLGNLDQAYLYSIMDLSHNLDLMRCCHVQRYEEAISPYERKDTVTQSPEQLHDFRQLKLYASRCIEVTEDAALCEFKEKEGLIESNRKRSRGFLDFNKDPMKCDTVLEQVPRPELFRRPKELKQSPLVTLFQEPKTVKRKDEAPPSDAPKIKQ